MDFFEIKYKNYNGIIKVLPKDSSSDNQFNFNDSDKTHRLNFPQLHLIWTNFEKTDYSIFSVSTKVIDNKILINYRFNNDENHDYNFYLNLGTVQMLTDKIFSKISGLEAEEKNNLLASSGLLSELPVPSDNEVKIAYIMWLYNYVSFIYILKSKFNINLFDWNSQDKYDVTHFITPENLKFVDNKIGELYLYLPKNLKYYCSLAQGGGWYLLFDNLMNV